MTGHIAALIIEWRAQVARYREGDFPDNLAANYCRDHADLLERRLAELESARDADCAEWRERMLTCGEAGAERCGYEACIVSLGGKP